MFSIDDVKVAINKSDYSQDKDTGTNKLINKLINYFQKHGIENPDLLGDRRRGLGCW